LKTSTPTLNRNDAIQLFSTAAKEKIMSNPDESDIPFEAEMIAEVLTQANAKQAWLFLLQVDGNGVFHVKGQISTMQMTVPATTEDICALLYRAEQQQLTLCGVSFCDGDDRLSAMVPKTIDEPHRSYFHRRMREYTRDILEQNGATVAMLEDDSESPVDGITGTFGMGGAN
jgi:hypothetical protein